MTVHAGAVIHRTWKITGFQKNFQLFNTGVAPLKSSTLQKILCELHVHVQRMHWQMDLFFPNSRFECVDGIYASIDHALAQSIAFKGRCSRLVSRGLGSHTLEPSIWKVVHWGDTKNELNKLCITYNVKFHVFFGILIGSKLWHFNGDAHVL